MANHPKRRKKPQRAKPAIDIQAANQVLHQFLQRNYDYMWLRTALEKARRPSCENATLIIGPSYALYGIQETHWDFAVNCSMHSQDLYYDLLCARHVLQSAEGGQTYKKCFIIMGSFSACMDLSRSTSEREARIGRVYGPIFHDAHNWEQPVYHSPWEEFPAVSPQVKEMIEQAISAKLLELGSYFSPIFPRRSFFDLGGRKWSQFTEEEQLRFGKLRAEQHNREFRFQDSLAENQGIFQNLIRLLCQNEVLPVVVMMPFSEAYNRYLLPELRETIPALLDQVPEEVHYVDFNEGGLFDSEDFLDPDHLSDSGADKVSRILVELFGA